jgi:hypothetical protein
MKHIITYITALMSSIATFIFVWYFYEIGVWLIVGDNYSWFCGKGRMLGIILGLLFLIHIINKDMKRTLTKRRRNIYLIISLIVLLCFWLTGDLDRMIRFLVYFGVFGNSI